MNEKHQQARRRFLKSVGASVPAGLLGVSAASARGMSGAAASDDESGRYINLATAPAGDDAISFRKHTLDLGMSETVAIVDMNGDGKLDIVSGENWYEQGPAGPDGAPRFIKHKFREIPYTMDYLEDLSDLAIDITGNGLPDLVSCSYWSKPLAWWENPGKSGKPWRERVIEDRAPVEFVFLVDILNTGKPLQLLPQFGDRNFPLTWYELSGKGGDDAWIKHEISPNSFGHGIGAGDVNGDGRTDIITPEGWFEAPEDPRNGKWIFHPEFNMDFLAGFIHVHDVNGDGLPDLVTTAAHDYGIFWYEQKKNAAGKRVWAKHMIDNAWSQAHALTLADLNGDGKIELVTGKRYYAHDHDPGANDPLGAYWYEQLKAEGPPQWKRHLIDYSTRTGAGMQVEVVDIDGDGDMDIVVGGKSGLYLFENLTKSR